MSYHQWKNISREKSSSFKLGVKARLVILFLTYLASMCQKALFKT